MTSRPYPDLHDHLAALDRHGLLVRVRRPINKETELHPLVRWQFRGGIPEAQRRAFLFEQVVGARGEAYAMPVLVGALAASRRIYSLGMGCPLEEIGPRWCQAARNPLPPRRVDSAPAQEVLHLGDENEEPGRGIDMLPVPISTPGFDIAPFLTAGHWVTRDPDSGIQNVGTYRAQVKGRMRLGLNASIEMGQGIHEHWCKYRARGRPMPAAIVVGAPPVFSYAAAQKLPRDVDEFAVAGALAGAPLNAVRTMTVDLLVPAEAEIIIEGFVDTQALEPEGPFGESHGYVNLQELNPFFDVTAISHRRDAIFLSIISQVTPSESSLIKQVAYEPLFLAYLRDEHGLASVAQVALHEPLTNLRKLVVVQMREPGEAEAWKALEAAAAYHPSIGKLIIAVDEDIDPRNPDALFWALSYRMNPERDLRLLPGRSAGHGPLGMQAEGADAALLFNAVRKRAYPPVSLPRREYMERARAIWEELALPPLRPEAPWHGYPLGLWSESFEEAAERAVRGDYWRTGEELIERRVPGGEPNTSTFRPDAKQQ
ncbi:MAG: UbiD family decarboxylase [Candidatus Tectomicrobia bacterium]|nr:UbiD family decarboxylase [Candidatus Tectomicrobia bacterium]